MGAPPPVYPSPREARAAGPAPTFVRHPVAPSLAPYVRAIIGYEEHCVVPIAREPASLDVPIVLTFAGSFRIALDRAPGAADRQTSFVAGLHPGFVAIASDGAAACLQLNLTPLGGRLVLGLPMRELASRMVALDDLPCAGLRELGERLAELPDWPHRLRAAEAWVAARIERGLTERDPDARATFEAYRLLCRTAGAPRIATLGRRLGWSRKRLAARFGDEIGLPPKTLARILRFGKAERLAAAGPADWAEIAAACGYSDQAHLVREFRALAGVTPGAWAAGRA
jgi:AraC-like DNA-binding protein